MRRERDCGGKGRFGVIVTFAGLFGGEVGRGMDFGDFDRFLLAGLLRISGIETGMARGDLRIGRRRVMPGADGMVVHDSACSSLFSPTI